jgi:hypothetical protein
MPIGFIGIPSLPRTQDFGCPTGQLLGYETRMVDAFLKSHGVEELEYTLEDIERDRETHRQLGL